MTDAALAEAEPGLVALEVPLRDIDPDFLNVEHHAALVSFAAEIAKRLGAHPVGGAIVRFLEDPARARFVWSDGTGDSE